MQFCQGQEEDTQCCFFNEAVSSSRPITSIPKLSLSGASRQRNLEKNVHGPPKESRLISKNNKKQKSHEKTKMSLSKMSGRKVNSSRDHCAHVQAHSHGMASVWGVKSGKVHNQQLYLQALYNQNNYLHTELNQYQQQCHHPTLPINSNKPPSARLHNYENHILKTNPHFSNNNPRQQLVMEQRQNKITTTEQLQYRANSVQNNHNSGVEKLTKMMKVNQIPENISTFQSTHRNDVHWSFQDKSRKNNSNPTPEPDNNLVYEVQKLQIFENPSRQSRAKNENFSEDKGYFAQSWYTEERSPYLNKPNLKTVQSFYSQDISPKKQVQQSIIVVDYFNPPENYKKEMEQRLMNRHHAPVTF